MTKPNLVLSGINLIDGGALSVYQDCINELLKNGYAKKYNIIALISNKRFFLEDPRITYIEFPKSKKHWLYRLYYEYIYFYFFSKKIKVDIWLSLHDITPHVIANKRYVYCHNPSPFNSMKFREIKYGWKYFLFSKLYKYLYKINIKRNTAIIVQQDWIREKFKKMFRVNTVIVAWPSIPSYGEKKKKEINNKKIFICPSYPRYFKNFQLICKAAEKLEKNGVENFQVIITIDGTENEYSEELVNKFNNSKVIKFCGIVSRKKLFDLYSEATCLIFVSRLETWGMPIIEFKSLNRPMILANLPYAHETVGNYDDVSFVNVNDYDELAEQMKKVIDGKNLGSNPKTIPKAPFAKNWKDLFGMIL